MFCVVPSGRCASGSCSVWTFLDRAAHCLRAPSTSVSGGENYRRLNAFTHCVFVIKSERGLIKVCSGSSGSGDNLLRGFLSVISPLSHLLNAGAVKCVLAVRRVLSVTLLGHEVPPSDRPTCAACAAALALVVQHGLMTDCEIRTYMDHNMYLSSQIDI